VKFFIIINLVIVFPAVYKIPMSVVIGTFVCGTFWK